MRKKSELRNAQQRTATALYEGVWVEPGSSFTACQVVLPMGGGKTATGLTAFEELQADGHADRMFVLAPKRVANLVWPAEPRLWEHLTHLHVVPVLGSAAQRMKAITTRADVYSIGVDNVIWFLEWLTTKDPKWVKRSVLAIDELSRFKNPRGKRLKALAKWLENRGLDAPILALWGLTGTPRPNGIEDQFGPLRLATRGKLWGRSFDRWRQTNMYPLDYMQHSWEVQPEKEPRLIADINKVTITIPISEMPDMPELNDGPDFISWVDLPPDAALTYKRMEKHLVAELREKRQTVAAANMAVATGKLSQIAQGFLYENPVDEKAKRGAERLHDVKMERLLELIEEAGGEQCVIVYDFQEDLARLRQEFPGLPYFGESDRKDVEIERGWNDKKLPLIAVHPASAGHGLNLQFGGRQILWYGFGWSGELYEQLLKRFQRPGAKLPVFSRPILARGTIDEIKYDRVRNKVSAQASFQRLLKEI